MDLLAIPFEKADQEQTRQLHDIATLHLMLKLGTLVGFCPEK